MSRYSAVTLLVVLLSLTLEPRVSGKFPSWDESARIDCYGDPLPVGAVARLGSTRFLVPSRRFDSAIAFAPDGKSVATTFSDDDDSGVSLLELPSGRTLRRLVVPGKVQLHEVAFSPDGKLLAVRSDYSIYAWETAGWIRSPRLLVHDKKLCSFAFLPDGRTLVVGCCRNNNDTSCPVYFWDLISGKEISRLHGNNEDPVEAVLVLRDQMRLLTYRRREQDDQQPRGGSTILSWNLADRKLLNKYSIKGKCTVFANDGKTVVVRYGTRTHLVWDCNAGRELFRIDGDAVHCSFSPDGRVLAVAKQFQELRQFEVATGKELSRFVGSFSRYSTLTCYSPDGKRLLTCSRRFGGYSVLRLWDSATRKELSQKGGLHDPVTCLAVAPSGRSAVSGGLDGTVRMWDISSGKQVQVYTGLQGPVRTVTVSMDGRVAACVDSTGMVYLLEVRSGRLLRRIDCEQILLRGVNVTSLAFAPDSKTLFAGTSSNIVGVYEVATPKLIRRVEGGLSQCQPIAFCAENNLMASSGVISGQAASPGKVISIKSLHTGKELVRVLAKETDECFGPPVFSPDGKILIATHFRQTSFGAFQHQIRAWEIATGREILSVHTPLKVSALAFSRDGQMWVAYSDFFDVDRALHNWSLKTEREISVFGSHLGEVSSLVFSPDGNLLISSSDDGTLLVWKTAPIKLQRECSVKQIEQYWAKLNGDDAAAAYRAMWALTMMPKPTILFLRNRISPAPAVDSRRIERLIDALDSERFSERADATEELEKLGELAQPAMDKAMARSESAEVRRRVRSLLEKQEYPLSSGRRLRALRVTALLEYISTQDAVRLLQELANGAPEAQLTREAMASLKRLRARGVLK
jgi:WD40 repeat protein